MSFRTISSIHSNELSCPINIQYDEKYHGLCIQYELNEDTSTKPFEDFYQLCQKMSPVQQQFFLEPIITDDENEKCFNFCPGVLFSRFFTQPTSNQGSSYGLLQDIDKLFIMKWVFSVACAIKILITNKFEIINIFDQSFFIDSKMEARFSFSNWNKGTTQFSTLPFFEYFYPPEKLRSKKTEDNPDFNKIEKECSYSLGVLISTLLNKKTPHSYFRRLPKDHIIQQLEEGNIFRQNIPECNWKEIVTKCISVEPEKRPDLTEIIDFLIQEKNSLTESKYNEFRKFVSQKFDIFGDINNSDLIKLINSKLQENVSATSEAYEQPTEFKVSDLTEFIKSAKEASFEDTIQKNCEDLLDDLYNLLPHSFKKIYPIHRNDTNQYQLMDDFLKHVYDDDYADKWLSKLTLLSIDNMNDNLSFFIKIYKISARIYFIIPKELDLTKDYFEKFNNEQFFVHFFGDSFEMIPFYPFLNVYNILYSNSSKNMFDKQQKLKWLCQSAKALSTLHEQKYTMRHFNSTNIFIDLNYDAHLLPSRMINLDDGQNSNKSEFDISKESDFNISYLAPEMFSETFSYQEISEKQLVYSFGIFILELMYGFRPDLFLKDLSFPEKKKLLLKKKKISIKKKDILYNIIETCLVRDPIKRKITFNDIADKLKKLLDNPLTIDSKEEDAQTIEKKYCFFFDDLEKAFENGALIPSLIRDHVYNSLNFDEKLKLNNYIEIYKRKSKKIPIFKLIRSVYAHKDDDLDTDQLIEYQTRNLLTNNKNIDSEPIQKDTKQTNYTFKSFEGITTNCLNYVQRTMKKVHNRPNSSYMHLSGLTKSSARQLMLRSCMNNNQEYRQQREVIVRNPYDFPYGNNLKMQNVEKIINDLKRFNILDQNIEIRRIGNGDIKIDSKVK